MKIPRFSGMSPVISLFGLGKSNLAAMEYIKQLYPKAQFYLRSDKPIKSKIPNQLKFSRIYEGERAFCCPYEDMILLSPSARRDRPEIQKFLDLGIIISSDLELFFESVFSSEALGITGSDGKSTVTFLTASLLKAAGTPAEACGNFGKSPLALGRGIFPVIELSSFQLSFISPKLSRAVITNITPNHLDWHKSFSEYCQAKLSILKNSDEFVFDFDDATSRHLLSSRAAFAAVSSAHGFEELKNLCQAEHYLTLKNGCIQLDGEHYIPLDGAMRRESYNIKNFLLAAALTLNRVSSDIAPEVIKNFGGLPHRCELVCRAGGIEYINSSIDTSPERCANTLRSCSLPQAVILCGKSKGLSYKKLAELLPRVSSGAALVGEVGEILAKELKLCCAEYPFSTVSGLEEAIVAAERFLGGKGGRVILSPAGTSFDRYENYEERGEDFRLCVKSILKQRK